MLRYTLYNRGTIQESGHTYCGDEPVSLLLYYYYYYSHIIIIIVRVQCVFVLIGSTRSPATIHVLATYREFQEVFITIEQLAKLKALPTGRLVSVVFVLGVNPRPVSEVTSSYRTTPRYFFLHSSYFLTAWHGFLYLIVTVTF